MNLEIESNQKESIPWEIKKREEQIAGVIECLNDYGDPFYRAARNMATSAEITEIPTINGKRSGRKYTTEKVEQFIRKGLHFQEAWFYDAIHRSTRVTSLKKRKTEKGNIRP